VVHGQIAEEILSACDENTVTVSVGDNVGANPALHFFRGLRHRNLAAIKLAATTGINQLHAKSGVVDQVRKNCYKEYIRSLKLESRAECFNIAKNVMFSFRRNIF